MTLIYRDERFLLHQTGAHPECPQRLKLIHTKLDQSKLMDRCVVQTAVSASDDDLLRVHSIGHLRQIREFAQAGGGRIKVSRSNQDCDQSGGSIPR